MSLRPVPARWFELLTSRDDLPRAVEAVARTGSIELETHSDTRARLSLVDLQAGMEEYNRLARRYHSYWPQTDLRPSSVPGRPAEVLERALRQLKAWEVAAAPLVRQLEALNAEHSDLRLLKEFLVHSEQDDLDFALLTHAGPALAARLYVLPPRTVIDRLPATALTERVGAERHDYLLAVGQAADLEALGAELVALKGRAVQVPDSLQGRRAAVRKQMKIQLDRLEARVQGLRHELNALARPYQLAEALGEIHRLDWFLTHVSSLPVSANFAWITGWTSDPDGDRLRTALEQAQVSAVVHLPPPPRDVTPPMVMTNPWWAQPFELFARMLGTPDRDEADPSPLLAVLAPLLFGYMFGDVGHGLVLLVVGLAFQRRWPLLRILVANGAAAMVFGLVFGSVFGREDLIPALWLHPVEQPLPVLLVPLAGGVVILVLGLLLNALEAHWRGELRRWWQVEAAVLTLYLSIIASFLLPEARWLALVALVWFFVGSVLQTRERIGSTLLVAAGTLLESVLQLLINTVSFVRVGAFALAHGGLSLAFNIMAEATDSVLVAGLVLVLGNLIVILLEGLVVTIQTTRLILFEFFIRFLRGTGRIFRPLAAPDSDLDTGRTT
jgi:V/A-type H+-transporting ATPase subunit I